MTVTERNARPHVPGVATGSAFCPQSRKAKPVKWWASAGCLFAGVTVWSWAWWIGSGDAHPAPKGPTPIPTSQLISARFWEVVCVVGAATMAYHFLVKPWRRERRFTLDGMLLLSWLLVWALQDPMLNYFTNNFHYSAVFINLGSWTSHIPGWIAPRSHLMGEPLLFVGGVYMFVMFGGTLFGCWCMRRAKARWPRIGTAGLIAVAVGVLAVVDLVMEVLWLRLGLYSFSGAIRWLTLWPGRYYQFPVYEAVCVGAVWGGIASLRYFKDDRGKTKAERGADEVRATPVQRQLLRFLAVYGACSTIFLAVYSLPMAFFGAHADNFPDGVLQRSYLTSGTCGLGTDYACPGPRVPMPSGPDSAHATPDGTWEAPKDLPVQPGRTGGRSR